MIYFPLFSVGTVGYTPTLRSENIRTSTFAIASVASLVVENRGPKNVRHYNQSQETVATASVWWEVQFLDSRRVEEGTQEEQKKLEHKRLRNGVSATETWQRLTCRKETSVIVAISLSLALFWLQK